MEGEVSGDNGVRDSRPNPRLGLHLCPSPAFSPPRRPLLVLHHLPLATSTWALRTAARAHISPAPPRSSPLPIAPAPTMLGMKKPDLLTIHLEEDTIFLHPLASQVPTDDPFVRGSVTLALGAPKRVSKLRIQLRGIGTMHGGGDLRYECEDTLLKVLEIELEEKLEAGEHQCVPFMRQGGGGADADDTATTLRSSSLRPLRLENAANTGLYGIQVRASTRESREADRHRPSQGVVRGYGQLAVDTFEPGSAVLVHCEPFGGGRASPRYAGPCFALGPS